MTMADRSGLKFVGFIFATITLAVMLTAATVVKTYADGGYSLESTAHARDERGCHRISDEGHTDRLARGRVAPCLYRSRRR